MLTDFTGADRVYIACGYTDLRRGIDGLAVLVQQQLKEQRPYLTNYLKDGRLEISNNRAERRIKPFVIDRKNFLFANTLKGDSGSAVMFSLIQTAIENGLDPYRYLTWLLRTANNADLTDAQAVQNLLPWNVPAECRVK